ncbi:immediate early response 3 interacting protein [Echinococcus multilocularis]|uniref:Immediate early response 3-interacting protein 1 n=1 Tax=Echinococcus multilocularis TaxID=6211 RepID=A0A068Y7Y2_ECHMU|nr:immediate early response 3 interacting protein [Echinococcus multilocularis]
MAFGLYALLEASVLVLNAVCILNEQRFLAKYGWGPDAYQFGSDVSTKSRLLTFITPSYRCKYSTDHFQTYHGLASISTPPSLLSSQE